MKTQKRTRTQWLALLGVIGTVFYFLHVIIGKMNYPGYSSISQAVSDLTAADAPSREIATSLATTNGFFTVTAVTLLCVFFQNKLNKPFRVGIYLFAFMEWVSAIGYMLFPLTEKGYAGTFQDVMHVIVTALVVGVSVASMILIAVGSMKSVINKKFGFFTIAVLGAMMLGSIGIGVLPIEYLGLTERVSVYSVVIYSAALCLFAFWYKLENATTE